MSLVNQVFMLDSRDLPRFTGTERKKAHDPSPSMLFV